MARFIEFEESNSYSQCLWVDLALRVLILAEPMFIQRITILISIFHVLLSLLASTVSN